MNIVDLIASQLSGDVLGKLGGLVGASESETKSATTAAGLSLADVGQQKSRTPSWLPLAALVALAAAAWYLLDQTKANQDERVAVIEEVVVTQRADKPADETQLPTDVTGAGARGEEGVMSPENLDRAAKAVAARIQEPPLTFSGDFENGSLDRVVRLGPDWYHIILREDTWYRFYFRVNGCAGREILFEFSCREINKPGYEEGKQRWIVSNPPIMPLVSYDRVNWQPVEHIEKHERDPGKYCFRHTFTADEAFVCHHHPYTYSDMLAWLKTLHGTPGLAIGTLGVTRNGFPQPVLTVTDNASTKDLVVLIGREDADEVTGSWGIEGLVRALLSPSLRDLRSRYVFKIVPMVGIDGVVAGAHHSAGYGYGGYRWHQEPSPKEIQNVKIAMRQWVRQGYRLKLAGKLHGFESFRFGDTLFDGFMTASDAFRQTAFERASHYARSVFKQEWPEPSWPEWQTAKGTQTLAIRPHGFFERFVLDEFGIYEVFGTHIAGDSPDAARRGGEAMMQGVAGYLAH